MSNKITAKSKNAGVHPVHNEDTQIYNAARPHGKMKAYVSVHHTVETKQRRIVKQTAMSPFTGSSFLNGGQITFKLDQTNVRVLNHIYVQVKVTNGTGAAVVFTPTPSWIDKSLSQPEIKPYRKLLANSCYYHLRSCPVMNLSK